MKKIIPAIILVFALTLPAFAEQEKVAMPGFTMPGAASNGWGGHHIAYTDNVFSLIVNPAAMVQTQERSFFTLGGTVFSPEATRDIVYPFSGLMDVYSGIMEKNFSPLIEKLKFLSDKNGKAVLGVDLPQLPLSIAWVANGFGFGLWNRTFMNLKINELNVEAELYADAMLPVGFAFKLVSLGGHSIDVGATVKPFVRVRAVIDNSITGLASEAEGLIENINLPVIAGGSANIGLIYRWDMGLQIGATVDDLFSFGKVVHNIQGEDNNSYYIPRTINLGAAWDLKIGRFWKSAPNFLAKTGLTIAVDWINFDNYFNQDDYLNSRNYLLDLRAGVEVSLFGFLKARAGVSEMLPSVGVGLDLGPIEIDAAYYGKEYGDEPGLFSTAALDLSISIRPGAKKRSWPWTRSAIIGD